MTYSIVCCMLIVISVQHFFYARKGGLAPGRAFNFACKVLNARLPFFCQVVCDIMTILLILLKGRRKKWQA